MTEDREIDGRPGPQVEVKKKRTLSPEHLAKLQAGREKKLFENFTKTVSLFPTQQAFLIEEVDAVGGKLYQCVLLTVQGNTILQRTALTHADSKAATLNQLRLKAYQFYFEERMPEQRPEGEVNANAVV